MKLAYLTNQYPAPSHTFIRRELLAHEAAGQPVSRYSIRRYADPLIDPLDHAERSRTTYLLDVGLLGLLVAGACTAVTRPVRALAALNAALRLARRSERGLCVHLAYLAEACILRRKLEAEGIEHLHAHFGTNPTAVAMLCRILGGPTYSFTAHGPDEFDRAPVLSLDAKAHHASAVVAISQFGRGQLCRWISPDDYAKLHVVHCGLDEDLLSATAVPIRDTRRIVFVGRLTATKGIFTLVDAAKILHCRGIACEIVMIGDGPDRPMLEAAITRHGLSGSIRLLGWQGGDSVRHEIQGSRALVLPSFAEGLPVVLMEALAPARPVVTTWVAAIPELVEQGVSGWLIPAGSAEATADALAEVLKTPCAKLDVMGQAGALRVRESHNAAVEAAKLRQLFAEAACEKSAS